MLIRKEIQRIDEHLEYAKNHTHHASLFMDFYVSDVEALLAEIAFLEKQIVERELDT